MKHVIISAALLLSVALLAPTATADVRNIDPVSDPLGSCTFADSIDSCMALRTMTIQVCKDSYGCPQCAMKADLSNSVCYRLFGNWGWCTCTAKGTYRDQFGNIRPNCKTQGSCSVR